MSAYANDPRVVRISDTEYWLPNHPQRWQLKFEGGRWNAYGHDEYCLDVSRQRDVPGDAIHALIGEPQ